MSSGPARITLKPRSAFSNWRDPLGLAEIRLTKGHPAAELSQPLPRELNRVRVLVQRHHIRAGPKNFGGVTAAAAGTVHDDRPGTRRQQFHRFAYQHGPMIGKILHFLCLLYLKRAGGEPDGPLEQQCVNHCENVG
jgi:hypothetical protein